MVDAEWVGCDDGTEVGLEDEATGFDGEVDGVADLIGADAVMFTGFTVLDVEVEGGNCDGPWTCEVDKGRCGAYGDE